MKKVYTQQKWRAQSRRRQKNELVRRKRRKKYKGSDLATGSYDYRAPGHTYSKYLPLRVPENFSFINNTEEVIEFFEQMHELFQRKKFIDLDLSSVSALSSDTITVLVSKLKDERFTLGCNCRGNAPEDPKLQVIFKSSGFYDFVKSELKDLGPPSGSIKKRRGRKVEPEFALDLIRFATERLYGKYRKSGRVYNTLLEAMLNTREHASAEERSLETWWVSVQYDELSKSANFTFVDNGVGIFESREPSTLARALSLLKIKSNAALLRKMLLGEIPSSTDIPYRGRGLPSMYENLQEKAIHNLIIITNDVYANIAQNKYRTLKRPFDGTFLYWEMHDDNRIH